ncbi:MAG: hypothetical protein ACREM1_00810 [Longimicrobiales bacterium]
MRQGDRQPGIRRVYDARVLRDDRSTQRSGHQPLDADRELARRHADPVRARQDRPNYRAGS